jgi:hypothetical protein
VTQTERRPDDGLSARELAEQLRPYTHFVAALTIGIHSNSILVAGGGSKADRIHCGMAWLKHSAWAALGSIFCASADNEATTEGGAKVAMQ